MGRLAKVKKEKLDKKQVLKAQAASRGLDVKDYLGEIVKGMTPMPDIIQDHLAWLSHHSGVPASELVIYHLIHSISILNAGSHLCGEPLINPFLSLEGGLLSSWDELYIHLMTEYQRLFVASELLEEKKS
jgi:hypothetical protein